MKIIKQNIMKNLAKFLNDQVKRMKSLMNSKYYKVYHFLEPKTEIAEIEIFLN